jgi:hypothetical protein
MTAKQTRPKKKPLTLDDFADAIQRDLARMVTKDDLKVIREDTKEEIRQLRVETGMGFRNLDADVKMMTDAMVSKADLANTLAEELQKSPYARQIGDLQARVNILESKLGIKPTRRAA